MAVCFALVLFAAIGIMSVLWALLGWLLPSGQGMVMVCLEPPDPGVLSRYRWLRGLGLLRCPVVIADVSLTAEGRELAQRLAARWSEVSVVPAQGLKHQQYERGGGRDGTSGTESGGGNGLRHHLSK